MNKAKEVEPQGTYQFLKASATGARFEEFKRKVEAEAGYSLSVIQTVELLLNLAEKK